MTSMGRIGFTEYAEGLDVGYRYFLKEGIPEMSYPFGYGLSYTSFQESTPIVDRKGVTMTVITNTGSVSGKHVVMFLSPVLQSNEFNFSIDNKEVAELLMRKSGCFVQLHYREFRGKLPWRGHNKFVVDKIEYIKDIYQDENVIEGSPASPAPTDAPAPSDQPAAPAPEQQQISL